MIYLQRPMSADIAACETDAHAARYEAAGWQRVSYEAYRDLWSLRDMRALARLWPAPPKPAAVEEDDAPYMLHFGGR